MSVESVAIYLRLDGREPFRGAASRGLRIRVVHVRGCLLNPGARDHRHAWHDSEFAQRLGSNWKGRIPLPAYALGIALAFVSPWISMAIYASIGVLWLIPDKRFEK